MRKLLIIFSTALFLLTGCSMAEHRSDSESVKQSSLQIDSSSKSSGEVEITSRTLVGDVQGVHHRDTVTYQGKKILSLHMEMQTDLPQDIALSYAELSPEEMTTRIQEGIKQDPQIAELLAIDGFKLVYSVTAERKFQTNVEMDFQKLTKEQIDKISSKKELGLGDFKDFTPERVILGLKMNGLKEE